MKRILIIAIAVVALVIGGWTAVWFSNRGAVVDQMQQALAVLERAGAPNEFDRIEVSGFPFGYRGEVVNLVFTGEETQVTLPFVAAEVSIEDTDTVRLTMPREFDIAPRGDAAALLQTLQVAADALTLDISLAGEQVYDLALAARSIVGAPVGEGPLEPFEITSLKATGALNADPAAPRLFLDAAAAMFQQRFEMPNEQDPEGPSFPGELRMSAPTLVIDGAAQALTSKAAAEKVEMDFEGGGVVEVLGLALESSANATQPFDAAPLATATDLQSGLEAFGAMALKGVLEGGDASAALEIGGMRGSGLLAGRQSKADVGPFRTSFDFGAERLGFEMRAEKMLIDAAVPGDQEIYYDVSDIEARLTATPAEAFDFSALAMDGLPPDSYGEILIGAVWGEILKGGALELVSNAGPSVTRAPSDPATGPFRRIESIAGPSSSRIAINPDEAVMKMAVDGLEYRVSEGLEAGGKVKAFSLDAQAPLRANPEEQKVTLALLLDEVTLDETLWTMLDPEGALTRQINGVSINAEAGVTIQRDVLSPDADVMNLGDPVAIPGAISVADTYLDLFGLRVDLAGEVAVFPLPNGALTLDVAGWRQFLEAAMTTPMGADPQTGATLIIMNNLYTKYGASANESAEDGPDKETFEIEIGPAGLTVNGQPYEG